MGVLRVHRMIVVPFLVVQEPLTQRTQQWVFELFVFHKIYRGFHACELIRKRRIEARRAEIATNAQEVFKTC